MVDGYNQSCVIPFQFRKHKHIVLCKMVSEVIFSIQYFLLGAYTGAEYKNVNIKHKHDNISVECVLNIHYNKTNLTDRSNEFN